MRFQKYIMSGILTAVLFFGSVSPVMAMETASSKIQAVNLSENIEMESSTLSEKQIDQDIESNNQTDNNFETESQSVRKEIVAKKLVDINEGSEMENTSDTLIESSEDRVNLDEMESVFARSESTESERVDINPDYQWFKNTNGERGCKDKNGKVIKDGYAISDAGNLCYLNADGFLEVKENVAVASSFPKKGLQGDYILSVPGVTGNHMLMNLYLNDAFSPEPTELEYNVGGNTYYFQPVLYNSLRNTFIQAQQRGIKVSVVLLLRGNDTLASMGAMYAGPLSNNPNQFYAFNPDSEIVKAFFEFSAMYLSSEGSHVDYWILGNEVNMPNTYNFIGTVDTKQNVDLYAKTFATCSNCIRKYDTNCALYISLDNHWTDNMNGYGIAGKEYLNEFFLAMKDRYPDVKWNLAYHLYAPNVLQTSSIWMNPDLNKKENNAKFLSPANLSILTDYVKDRIGPDCRIILSENGYDVHEGEHIQAMGLAACYEAAKNDPMVDAVIFRTLIDEGTEGFLDLAMIDANNHEREAYGVYQTMETPLWDTLKIQYLPQM